MNRNERYLEYLEKNIKEKYMIRGRKKEKEDFRKFIISEMQKSNYEAEEFKYKTYINENTVNVESNVENSKIIFTAHYDTPPKNLFFILINIINLVQRLFGVNKVSNILFVLILSLLIKVFFKLSYNYGIIIYSILIFEAVLLIVGFLCMKNKNNMIDNTSGVVGLLNLAKMFDGREDVGFIFFDNEEIGLKGSKGAAKRLYGKKDICMKDKLIVNLDCICSKSDLDEWIISTTDYNKDSESTRDNFIDKLSREIKVIKKKKASKTDYLSFKENSSISIGKYSKGIISGHYLKDIHSYKDKTLYISDIESLTNKLYNISKEVGILVNNSN